jgi:hypothetical protein
MRHFYNLHRRNTGNIPGGGHFNKGVGPNSLFKQFRIQFIIFLIEANKKDFVDLFVAG